MLFSGDFLDMSLKQIQNYLVEPMTTDQMNTLGLTLSPAQAGLHIYNVEVQSPYYWTGTVWSTWPGAAGAYTDQKAQDAIGGILANSNTIQFQYSGVSHQLSASARLQMSLVSDSGGIKLDGDLLAPAVLNYYGTDAAGVKGFHAFPTGLLQLSFPQTVANNSGMVALQNDVTDPGNSQYYGTNTSGVKGWYILPNSGKTFSYPQSVLEQTGVISFVNDQATPGNFQYYGTNGSGTKGWFALPNVVNTYSFTQSLHAISGTVTLTNDQENPGINFFYGTNVSGLKGWYPLQVLSGYTDLMAQAAVGSILTNTTSITFSYGSNQIRAVVNDSYLFSLLRIQELRFKIGDSGAPLVGDNTFTLQDCSGNNLDNHKIVFFRERQHQYEGDDYALSGATATITTPFENQERCVIWAFPLALWNTCVVGTGGGGGISGGGFPLSFPIIF